MLWQKASLEQCCTADGDVDYRAGFESKVACTSDQCSLLLLIGSDKCSGPR